MIKKIELRLENNVHNKTVRYFSIFAVIFIPLFTYLFATKESPFDYTFSMIWNKLWHRLSFIIRWILTGFMLTFYILRLFILKSFTNKNARKLLIRSLVFLVLTVLIPSIEQRPILKGLHFVTAIIFSITLILSLYFFITYLQKTKRKIYNRSMILFLITVFWSLITLFIFWKNWLFELFFFLALTIFLLTIHLSYKKTSFKKIKS